MLKVRVYANVHPTEERERVEQAVSNLFPDAALSFEKGRVSGESSSLTALIKKVHSQAIADAARAALVRGLEGETETSFALSKQAAYVGKVNFAEVAHPLGDLHVVVTSDRLMDHLADIAPPPERGDRSAERRREKKSTEAEFQEHYTEYAKPTELPAPGPEDEES